jgi:hypothetical protein
MENKTNAEKAIGLPLEKVSAKKKPIANKTEKQKKHDYNRDYW